MISEFLIVPDSINLLIWPLIITLVSITILDNNSSYTMLLLFITKIMFGNQRENELI